MPVETVKYGTAWVRNKRKSKPWFKHYMTTYDRCHCKKNKSHYRNGIKLYLKEEDFKYLWFRDKAYLLKQPSIDRIDNDGHYTLSNCRFIELSENIRRLRKTHCKRGHLRQGKNIRITRSGHIECKLCRKIREKKYRYAKAIAKGEE